MAPNHTSDFSDPTGCFGLFSTQYEQMPASQQQLGYPGWGYAASQLPQNNYTEANTTGNHHISYYTTAQYPSPSKDDSLEAGKRPNGKEKKKRKIKTTFSFEQLLELKRRYQQNSYLDPIEQVELAASLELSEIQVRNWFRNRRARYKKNMNTLQQVDDGGCFLPQRSNNGLVDAPYNRVNFWFEHRRSQEMKMVKASQQVGDGGGVHLADQPRQMKARMTYSSLQLRQLNRRFQRSQYLNEPERSELGASLGLAETQVDYWFHHQRIREEKNVAQLVGGPHQQLKYEGMSYRGQVETNQLASHYQSGGVHHSSMQQQLMKEAADEDNHTSYNWQYFYEP